MKHFKTLLSLVVTAIATSSFAAEKTVISAEAELKDGSTVKGGFLGDGINGSAIFAKNLKLGMDIVRSVAFSGTNGEAKVELVNNDRLSMTVTDAVFKVKSLLGELTIPRASVRSISFSARQAGADGLLFHCTFDDRESIEKPLIGRSGIFQGGVFGPGKTNNALNIKAYSPGARFDIPAGTISKAGTIEFWAETNEKDVFTTEGCPRFFVILGRGGKGGISHDWNTNNGSGGNGLTFRIDGLRPMASCPHMAFSSLVKSEYILRKPPSGWHHYALVWDADGLEIPREAAKVSAAVYFDGQKVMSVPFRESWKGPVSMYDGATVYFPNLHPDYLRTPYAIDDFKIWNYAKTDFGL